MLTWKAPAKINLFLHVVGQYEDGYHELQTAYQMLDWHDELEFESTRDGRIRRRRPIQGIAESEDITIRTAHCLRRLFPGAEGVIIRCQKKLPIGAGLGGGSSDAAATLLALNELWNLRVNEERLAEVGALIGADVPVFVHGRNAWAEGRGEVLSNLSIPERMYLVVYPNRLASTERVFREFRGTPFRERIPKEAFDGQLLGNDLEAVTCRLYPEVRTLIEHLKQWGKPRMTGSGSAVYLPIESRAMGESIRLELPAECLSRVCVGQAS